MLAWSDFVLSKILSISVLLKESKLNNRVLISYGFLPLEEEQIQFHSSALISLFHLFQKALSPVASASQGTLIHDPILREVKKLDWTKKKKIQDEEFFTELCINVSYKEGQ